MILYHLSYCGYNILSKDAKKRLFSLQKIVKSYGWISTFIGAVSPISGNLIYVSLGLAKYNPLKFASAIFAGKIMLNLIIVLISIILGRPFIDGIIDVFHTRTITFNVVIEMVITLSLLFLSVFILLKVDWNKIVRRWFPWLIKMRFCR